jgi:single-stranded-DNA-specific exonuclease
VHPAICRLLATRGIKTYDEAKDFFRPELSSLHDPFIMKGMKDAVERIAEAVQWHERILVYGDYDVDGTTSVAVVYSFLRRHYPDLRDDTLQFYIPHRYREGYGVSKQGIDYAKERGYTLLITLDCGIKSVELTKYAQSLGIDVIVCDHHTPDDELPRAVAILNPKQPGCPYPFKELSGCGIGFKLVQALARHWKLPEEEAFQYLDLVATSIAADIVPVDGENRILAFYGLKKANENPSHSIRILKEIGGLQRALTISDLVFVIGPRVNAAGRMDDARKAVDMFVAEDPAEVRRLAEILQTDNLDRKEIDRTITSEALALLQDDTTARAEGALETRKSTVIYQEHWHKGVVGIVASRLLDHYYRPTIVLTQANGKVTGSARSVSGFNIYEALHACRDLLENYGGHFYAAGMTMAPEKVRDFQDRFEAVVSSSITPEQLIREIEIDAELQLHDIRPGFYKILKQFEPFGPANMRPVFISRRLTDHRGFSRVVKDAHLKVVLEQGSTVIDGIGFGMAEKYPLLQGGPVDVVYTLDENEWDGKVKLQMKVVDVRASY